MHDSMFVKDRLSAGQCSPTGPSDRDEIRVLFFDDLLSLGVLGLSLVGQGYRFKYAMDRTNRLDHIRRFSPAKVQPRCVSVAPACYFYNTRMMVKRFLIALIIVLRGFIHELHKI